MRGGREKPFIASSIGWPMTKPKQGTLPIRRASQGDRPEWLRMRAALWPDETHAKHREEMDEYLRGKGAVAYVVARPSGGLAGFVEATIRPHADGCDTSPVGYVEGCAAVGCGYSGRHRVEVWRQAAGIPRFEQPSLQQDDRGAIPLAPDRTTGGLEDLIHRREDVGVIVSFLESELAAVVVLQRF